LIGKVRKWVVWVCEWVSGSGVVYALYYLLYSTLYTSLRKC
jgi:hypothetical protein